MKTGRLKGSVSPQENLPTYVSWQTLGAGCPTCQENEAAGVVPPDFLFPGGVTAPPQHPFCQYSLQLENPDSDTLPLDNEPPDDIRPDAPPEQNSIPGIYVPFKRDTDRR